MEVTILGKTLAEVSDYFTNTCCIIGKKPRHPGQQKEIENKICYFLNKIKKYFLEKEKNEREAMVSAVSLDQKVKLLEPVVNK